MEQWGERGAEDDWREMELYRRSVEGGRGGGSEAVAAAP